MVNLAALLLFALIIILAPNHSIDSKLISWCVNDVHIRAMKYGDAGVTPKVDPKGPFGVLHSRARQACGRAWPLWGRLAVKRLANRSSIRRVGTKKIILLHG